MSCTPFSLPGGGSGIICTRGRRKTKPCDSCGNSSSRLCDYPVTRNGKRETCDRELCSSCARPGPQDTDFCPAHWRIYEANGKRLAL